MNLPSIVVAGLLALKLAHPSLSTPPTLEMEFVVRVSQSMLATFSYPSKGVGHEICLEIERSDGESTECWTPSRKQETVSLPSTSVKLTARLDWEFPDGGRRRLVRVIQLTPEVGGETP